MKLYFKYPWSVHSILSPLAGRSNKPVLALSVVVELALDHVDHDIITDQATLVHDLLGLSAQISLLGDL